MIQSNFDPTDRRPSEELVYKLLTRLGMQLETTVERADILAWDQLSTADPLGQLSAGAEQSGITLRELELESTSEATGFIREGYPLVVAGSDGSFTLVSSAFGRKFETTQIRDGSVSESVTRADLQTLIAGDPEARIFVAKKQLDLDSVSSSPFHADPNHHSEHLTPLRRFIGLLRLELRDIWTVFLFALVAGVLTLATPLAVESLVNVVSWGTYVQPLIVLGLILLCCLGIAGVLRVLQKVVVELIQRRQFVRIVSDLSHRFPRANQKSIEQEYPRELANRVFDIMTIQKATAVLLLDGVSIVLTTTLGMILLALYHPFLLGFNIVLLFSMISITWLLGRGGIRTAIDESVTKYRVVHWLQDVLASPSVFKSGGGQSLAIQRANQLTADYVNARRRQFNVVIRQSAFAITLQVLASTAVLALGGWLVIDGQLTLGQLVASELVVTVVVGAFAKAGKSIEKFYDLMAGVDKVGHLIDIPADRGQAFDQLPEGPVEVRWRDLVFERVASRTQVGGATVAAGSKVAIIGDDVDGRSDLAKSLAGLRKPTAGIVQVANFDPTQALMDDPSRLVGYAGDKTVFHGTLRENVDLGRPGIGVNRVREVLSQLGLDDTVLRLPEGIQTELQTGGYPLTDSDVALLVIARAIIRRPSVLVIDRLLDELAEGVRQRVWQLLSADDQSWTLVVVTNHEAVAQLCDSQISVRKSNEP